MVRRLLCRILAFARHGRAEAELSREIASHLQMLEDELVARGAGRAEARDAARRAFGGQIEQMKERQRDTRSFRVLDESWLDLKLSVRMLVRYPALTTVAVLGLAVAIAIATGGFAVATAMLNPAMPLAEGDRVVALQYWDASRNDPERRVLRDFETWRGTLGSFAAIGAYQEAGRNLITAGRSPEAVSVAQMTASGFAIARIAPLLGRYLVEGDERPGADPVIVIGHDEWQSRFAADPNIVGQRLTLGAANFTVVGVMPPGFRFPVNHQFWVPLPSETAIEGRFAGPEVYVFGRLAQGATRESAQAELAAVMTGLNADAGVESSPLRAQVLPYTYPFSDMDEPDNLLAIRVSQFLVAVLLGVVATNVAILVYARTAARHAEIAVRSALGASRGRIVVQLSLEALTLSLLSAVVALVLLTVASQELRNVLVPLVGDLPFWIELGVTPGVAVYAAGLAVATAAVVGVVPALKATGRSVQRGLHGISAGGGGGMRLGGTWTVLIIAQVAVAVALLPATVYHAWDATSRGVAVSSIPAEQFLRARLVMERDAAQNQGSSEFTRRYGDRVEALLQRLRAEPQVIGVTTSLAAPGEEPAVWMAIDGVASPETPADFSVSAGNSRGHQVALNRIDSAWLGLFGVAMVGGRTLAPGDADGRSVLVNQSFVRRILGGGNALGVRVRLVGASGDVRPANVTLDEWAEIVGVIDDFPKRADREEPRVYSMAAGGQVYPVLLTMHVRSHDATVFATRLREITTALDPALQLRGVDRLDAPALLERSMLRFIAFALVLVTLSVVALSAAGIYALMSFAVEQRRKEIGIRTALGADQHRILAAIFARALVQLGSGAAAGIAIALLLEFASGGETMAGRAPLILPIVAALMTAVGLLAAFGPARRALRTHPIDALR